MNNKYYIVSYYVEDENDYDATNEDILGVFSSKEKAEEAIKEEAIKKELKRSDLDVVDDFNFKDNLFEYSFSIKEYDLDNASCVVTPKDLYRCLYHEIDDEEEA